VVSVGDTVAASQLEDVGVTPQVTGAARADQRLEPEFAYGHDQSAAYKLIGPLFDETGGYYQGHRIA